MSNRREWMLGVISAEIVQKREEGCDLGSIEKAFKAMGQRASLKELEDLLGQLHSLEQASDFRYVEPSDLDGIRTESSGFRGKVQNIRREQLWDRMHGAWLGRCVGCLLGKPVEGWSKEEIEAYLKQENAYPLRDYFPRPSEGRWTLGEDGLLGEIDGMPPDDDIDYTILGLHILEKHGLGVTSDDIAEEWLRRLPYKLVYTAERSAYRNLVNMFPIPESAMHHNPYREWIGAQIRADSWGYVLPGRPSEAAELSYRDARITHVKNGIYGEMMASAMISEAFAVDDPREVVEIGLSVVPRRSRLFEAVENVKGWAEDYERWLDCWSRMKKEYGHYSSVHTINNAMNVIIALLYGAGDYSDTITIAVMTGWDTDCNGATAGSIAGAMVGASQIPEKWKEPLSDRVISNVRGYQESRISDLANRMHDLALRHM